MPRIRTEHTGRYSLPRETFMAVYRYALLYPQWKLRMEALEDTSRAIRYDIDKVQTSIEGSPTEDAAMRIAEIKDKMRPIEEAAKRAGDDLSGYILRGVTEEGVTYEYLRSKYGMPCGEQQYYRRRRYFYFLLAISLGY